MREEPASICHCGTGKNVADATHDHVSRKKQLAKAEAETRKRHRARVDGFFERYDKDQNNLLDRDELARLLEEVEPTAVTNSAVLDVLISQVDNVENIDRYDLVRAASQNEADAEASPASGGVSKEQILAVIEKYQHYARDQQYADGVFRRFDTDGSGRLEKGGKRNTSLPL